MRYIDFFDRGAERYPGNILIHEPGRAWTYADTKAWTHRIANALMAAGLGPDSKVVTYGPNSAEGYAAQFGILRAGCIWLPLNVRNSVYENIEILQRMDAEWLFFHSSKIDEAQQMREQMPELKGLVCLDRETPIAPALQDWAPLEGPDATYFVKGALDTAVMLTTSGTTGRPKGVALPNLAWETMIASYMAVMPYDRPPVHIVAAPLTHAAGCLSGSLLPWGGTHVLLEKPDPLAILEAIHEHQATTVFAPPTLIYMMLAHPRVREFDYSSLRYFLYGAAPMSEQKLREATEIFGPVMTQTYGQTEVLMVVTFMSAAEHAEALTDPTKVGRLRSAGRAGPLAWVEIMDDEGNILGPDEPGEIVSRSNLRMTGYYKNPEATEEASQWGWHHSGDVGVKDADGYIYIVDRKKDLIISGGFNVYPSEVEQALWMHPSVQDCAVIGVADEKWGERVTAAIELKPGAIFDEVELIAFCKERVGSVKAPKVIEAWEALPRSPVGKVLKREIRDDFNSRAEQKQD
ncbi:MAG: o-succinylbenzoate--CoA ligase [Salinisphaeraceae bacterium]|nr:o-succinylbenzoate--CoA ligase [Salinisphaeraceae bacterium]